MGVNLIKKNQNLVISKSGKKSEKVQKLQKLNIFIGKIRGENEGTFAGGVGGWMDGRADLRIAYSNQKLYINQSLRSEYFFLPFKSKSKFLGPGKNREKIQFLFFKVNSLNRNDFQFRYFSNITKLFSVSLCNAPFTCFFHLLQSFHYPNAFCREILVASDHV